MKILSVTTFLLLTQLLSGCAEPAAIVGTPGPGVTREEVRVYFAERPLCDFETIAHIKATGGYFSLQRMLLSMRMEAAELGANGLYVVNTQQLDSKEYLGTAKAIRCLPA